MASSGSNPQDGDKRFKAARPLPGPLLVGRGTAAALDDAVAPLGLRGPAVVVADTFTARFAPPTVPDGLHVIAEASVDEVVRVERRIASVRPRFVAGLGGGKPIDVAKLAAFRKGLPFVSVPTAPSHDGVASGRASLVHLGARHSIGAKPPAVVVADLDVLETAPARLVASGRADIVSNLTAVLDWELARRVVAEDFDEAAAGMSREAGEEALALPARIGGASMEALVRALVKSGTAMALAGTSRPASGSEHKFSHALDALGRFDVLHGESCGMGAVLMMALHGGDWRGLRDALAASGAPVRAKQLSIPPGVVVEALMRSREIRPERYTILEHLAPSEGEFSELAARVGVSEGG